MSNRRDFLKNISLFTAGGLLAGKAGSVNAANAALGVVDEVHASKEIGLQIYSLSQELYKGDVAANLRKVIADACDRVKNLDEEKYFGILKNMAEKYLLPREGEICFSKKDLERMPAGFREEIKSLAQKKGGVLEISGETRNIDGGFILIYGGIEENCSIDAMFAEKRDELLDQVRKILFA